MFNSVTRLECWSSMYELLSCEENVERYLHRINGNRWERLILSIL